MELIRQDDEYSENKLLFWVIVHILLFLSLFNLSMYIITTTKCIFSDEKIRH